MLGGACHEHVGHQALAFDIGFFNGDDTALLLMQGYRVVAIEANEALVELGRRRFATALKHGQLQLLHQALARTAEEVGTERPFYVNRYNLQWSSFHRAVGCRTKDWPRTREGGVAVGRDCDVRAVRAESCAMLFATYGVPTILKLDIEGSESPCVEAILQGTQRPSYVVIESQPLETAASTYARLHAAGFDRFKWVDQKALVSVPDWGESSGPVGEGALDCHFRYSWRNLSSLVRWHIRLHRNTAPPRAAGGEVAAAIERLRYVLDDADVESVRESSQDAGAEAHGCPFDGWADVHARHRLVRARFAPFGTRPPARRRSRSRR